LKKVFQLQQDNKHPDRVLESIKHEVRKYVKRERKKTLPKEAVFWDFDCRFGATEEAAKVLTFSELMTALEHAKADRWQRCYVEIIARAAAKSTRKDDTLLS